MRELLERFRYRFELWRREQRDDWIGPPGTHPPDYRAYWREYSRRFRREESATARPKIWDDPKFRVMLTESTLNFVVREAGVYFVILALLTAVGSLIDRIFPAAYSVVSAVFIVLVCIWTLLDIVSVIEIAKRRKAYRSADPEII